MTKTDIIIQIFGDSKGIDLAVPQNWYDKVRELGINPEFFVWSYRKNRAFGEPINILEEYAKLIIKEAEKIPQRS